MVALIAETEEPLATIILSTPSSTAIPSNQDDSLSSHRYLKVADVSIEHALEFVGWEDEGQSFVYAVQETWSDNLVPYIEPKNWSWWQFSPTTNENMPSSPPDSEVTHETREALSICLSPSSGLNNSQGCVNAQILFESPFSDLMIYAPAAGSESTWIAQKDGSGSLELKEIQGLPSGVHWASDGHWAVVSIYAYRAPGMELHYLVNTENYDVQLLDTLTGHNLRSVNYLRPLFSPNGRYLIYAATDSPDETNQDGYGLFMLDMSTLRTEKLSKRFGPYQWGHGSNEIYMLDNALVFEFAEDRLAPRKAALYYLDLSSRPIVETRLYDGIEFYPYESPSARHWAYSPEAQAIGMVGLQPKNELGILFLAP